MHKSYTIQKKDNKLIVKISNGTEVIIDEIDSCLLEEFPSWQTVKGHIYIMKSLPTIYGVVVQKIYLHRAIMVRALGFEKIRAWQVDHKDRNKLNNSRSNLRLASPKQNSANAIRQTLSNTGFRGVTAVLSRNLKKGYVIYLGGKNLGYRKTVEEAARLYDKAAKDKYGEFAVLNFPEAGD